MSVLIKDKTTGEWEQVAGNGKAEYGASTVRTGSVTNSVEILPNGYILIDVVFSSPMPDTDYLISLEVSGGFWHTSTIYTAAGSKTVTGFRIHIGNPGTVDTVPVSALDIKYTAFKLYTDTEYNPLLDLPDRVETLETVSTMTVTKQGNYINGTNFHGKKIGKVATIEINGDTGASIPWAQITTVGVATGCATPLTELKCTADMLSITTGYDLDGNAIVRYIPPYSRAWIGDNGNIQVFLANPGASDTSYTGNLFIGGSYITK